MADYQGAAELYREPFTEPRPASWTLANALSEVWRDAAGHLPAQGYRVFSGPHPATSSVLVLWRSNAVASVALTASADAFFDMSEGIPASRQLIDSEGKFTEAAMRGLQRSWNRSNELATLSLCIVCTSTSRSC